jgi:kynurenine formamidase
MWPPRHITFVIKRHILWSILIDTQNPSSYTPTVKKHCPIKNAEIFTELIIQSGEKDMIIGNIIDLSRTISEDMPIYPGTEQPVIINPCTIDGCGFAEKKITLYSHTGTHMDAPSHILKGAPCLEDLGLRHFIGSGFMIDLSRCTIGSHSIELSDLMTFKNILERKEFILLHTGWGKYWGKDDYFKGYPILTKEAANWLASFELKGIGIDMISIDSPDTIEMQIHKIFLGKNTVIIENLANLTELAGKDFTLSCFPLKIDHSDGSPVRAVAIIN